MGRPYFYWDDNNCQQMVWTEEEVPAQFKDTITRVKNRGHKWYRLQGKNGTWHYYWGFVNGVEQVMGRPADATHPANEKWAVAANPPDGYDHFDYLLESETAGG